MHDTTVARDGNWPQPVLHGYDGERGVWETSPTGIRRGRISLEASAATPQTSPRSWMRSAPANCCRPSSTTSSSPPRSSASARTLRTSIGRWIPGLERMDVHEPGHPGYTGAGGTLPDEGWTMVSTPRPPRPPTGKDVRERHLPPIHEGRLAGSLPRAVTRLRSTRIHGLPGSGRTIYRYISSRLGRAPGSGRTS